MMGAVWRPILAKITTLHEVETYWSIDDLADAHEALDLKADLEKREVERNNRKKKP